MKILKKETALDIRPNEFRKIMNAVEVVRPLYRVYLNCLDKLQEWLPPEISGTLISLKEYIQQ
jgi:hypothetical protein